MLFKKKKHNKDKLSLTPNINTKDNSPSPLFSKSSLADAQADSDEIKISVFSTMFSKIGQIGLLLKRTFSLFFHAKCDKGATFKLAYRYTNGSFFFIIIAMAFVGIIMIHQSTVQMERTIGDTTLVGASFLKLLFRVLGPTVIGMLIACKVGAGISAELGAMAVTDQLDAMRICSADPIEVLMVPRLRGALIACISLTILGSFASVIAGMYTGLFWFGTPITTYLNFSLVTSADIIQGMIKATAYGIAIPIVSGSCGLHAYGGAKGVGQATTDAVVGSSFVIVFLDSIISFAVHAVNPL